MKTHFRKLSLIVLSLVLSFQTTSLVRAEVEDDSPIVEETTKTIETQDKTQIENDNLIELDDEEPNSIDTHTDNITKNNNILKNTKSIIKPTTWEEVPDILLDGVYDFSLLPQNPESPKTISINNSITTITSTMDKSFDGLQIRISNNGQLNLDNVSIFNNNPDNQGAVYAANYRLSPIVVEDATNNKIIVNSTAKIRISGRNAGISVNNKKNVEITGTGVLDVTSGYLSPGTTSYTGAAIGGDFNNVYGTLTFSDKITVTAKMLSSHIGAAAIGTGENASKDTNGSSGSILIKDNAQIVAHSDGGAAIGSGYDYGPTSPETSKGTGVITIQDNAVVEASTRGSNASAIGTSYGTRLDQINIKDSANVKAVAHADYNEAKYPENSGFGNFSRGSMGAGIGVSEQNIMYSTFENPINILGTPTIIAGGNAGGIIISNGNLNISGGKIKIYSTSDSGIGIQNAPTRLLDDSFAKINISGTKTEIDINMIEIVTQEHLDMYPNIFDTEKVGDLVNNYSAGIGYYIKRASTMVPEINISEASINISSHMGAGIGISALYDLPQKGNINIFNNANLTINSMSGAGVGTGQQSSSDIDISIQDSTINIETTTGSGIGSGVYVGYNKEENEKPIVNISVLDSILNLTTKSGAGIGTGTYSSAKVNALLKDSTIKAISTTGAGLGGGQSIPSYPSYGSNIIIDGGSVHAQSSSGAGIGGGQNFDSKGYIKQTRNETSEGTLKIIGNANVRAFSGGLYKGVVNDDETITHFFFREAITATLLDGSDLTMASHTLEPKITPSKGAMIQVINGATMTNNPIREIELPEGYRSYAYSLPNTASTSLSEILVENGQKQTIVQFKDDALGIDYREVGRHPSLTTFMPVNSYKGLPNEYNDNTYVTVAFNIVYHGNENTSGTSPIDTTNYKKDEQAKVLGQGTLLKDGHIFTGWNTKADGSGISYKENDLITIESSVDLYAQWNPKMFTITYESNGGTLVDSETVEYNKSFSKPTDPTKENYIFIGWYIDRDLTKIYDFSTLASQDITVYAKWEKVVVPVEEYTVTYTDGSGNEQIFKNQIYANLPKGTKTPTFNGVLQREGYTFKGWNPSLEETVEENITYTAEWTKNDVPILPSTGIEPNNIGYLVSIVGLLIIVISSLDRKLKEK